MLRSDRVAFGIGQRGGVGDRAVFIDSRRGRQRYGRGVVHIINDGADWSGIWSDGFKVATSSGADAFADGGWALVDVVADGHVQRTCTCAGFDGDGLAAVEGDGDRTVLSGNRVALGIGQRSGVGDRAVFVHGRRSSQRYGGAVVHIVDDGADRSGIRSDGFEVAAGRIFDRLGNRRWALVDVITNGHVQRTCTCTGFDGDGFAAVEGDRHRSVLRGDWIAFGIGERGGVSNGAVFVHSRRSSQRHGGGVVYIIDDSADWSGIWSNGFQIAAGRGADALANGGWALIHVVADGHVQRTRTCAGFNGNGLAAVQRDGDWPVLRGDWIAFGIGERGGVSNGAVFVHSRRSSQRYGGAVVHIVDDGADRSGIRSDGFEIAASSGADAFADGGWALVDVITNGHVQRTCTCTGFDGDGFAAVEGDRYRTILRGDWIAFGVGQGRGVGNGAVFIDRRRGGQRHGGGVVYIINDGADGASVWRDGFEVAAGCIFDRLGNGRWALVNIVANADIQRTHTCTGLDGDGFAAVEGDRYRTILRGDWIAFGVGQGCGVSDRAVFIDSRRSSQRHGRGVVHIVNDGADGASVWRDGFEVAAGRIFDRLGNRRWALVDVVANADIQRTRTCTGLDGDGFAAIQCDRHRSVLRGDWIAFGIGQRCGVSNGAVFVDSRRSGQRYGGGVVHIVNDGADGASVWRDGFEVAAGRIFDRFGNCRWALVDVITNGHVQGTRTCAGFDGDGFAAVEGDRYRTILRSDRVAFGIGQRGGVGNGAVFVDSRRGRQRYGRGVVHIINDGADWSGIWSDGFKVATSRGANAFADGGWALVDVVADGHVQRTCTCAGFDGDGLAAVEGDGDRTVLSGNRVALGIGQRSGVGDRAVFVHGRRSSQRYGGAVVHIVDDGADWSAIRSDGFEIAASSGADAFADGGWALVDVVANGHVQRTRTCTGFDGDGLAAVEGDRYRTVLRSDWIALGIGQRSGVGNGAVFIDGRRSSQRYGGGVVHIVDDGADRSGIWGNGFQIAAGCGADALADGGWALVHVIAGSDVQRTRTCTGFDGDGLAAVQRDGDWTVLRSDRVAFGVGQGCGVSNGAVFVDSRRSGQCDGGGVVYIINDGADGASVWRDGFEVAAGCIFDRLGNGRWALVNIVANADIQRTHTCTGLDGNGFAAVEGDRYRTILRSDRIAFGVGQRSGVSDRAVFIDGRRSSQRYGGGVVYIIDDSADRSGIRSNGFEVATGCVLDRLGNRRWALIHVVADGHVQRTCTCTGFDGDGFAAIERDGDRTVLRSDRIAFGVGQRSGVSDRAVFIDGRRSSQRYGGGVVYIIDDSADRSGIRSNGFEVATGCVLDRLGNRRWALIHVVADGHVQRTCTCTGFDGDGFAAIERDGDRTILRGDWIAFGIGQGGGVSDGAVFVHGRCSGERYGGGVVYIVDDGADRSGIRGNGFKVATSSGADAFADGGWALVDVVADGHVQRTRT
ncbi:hypothetical protein E3Z27_00955 [Pseudomonas mediterranea]|nr:hypothetical protein E3Z27_00955 [Pseudomonas mediterranea]